MMMVTRPIQLMCFTCAGLEARRTSTPAHHD